jgi:uncharacterized protein DUF6190
MSSRPLIDASVFMGMHAHDDNTRLACVSFMAARFDAGVVLSWEQIGRCDDIVWSYAAMFKTPTTRSWTSCTARCP